MIVKFVLNHMMVICFIGIKIKKQMNSYIVIDVNYVLKKDIVN